jgi:DNA primase
MYINNVEELVEALKPRLKDYLVSKIGLEASQKSFKCYVHQDNSPSMAYNPKTGNTTVHCFSCGATHDIFSAAAHFDNLPATGPEWVTQTLPALAELFNLQLKLGEASPADKERSKLYKLMSDISNILAVSRSDTLKSYLEKRGWSDEKIIIGQIAQQDLIPQLTSIGWDVTQLYSTLLLNAKNPIFGDDRITFVIKDYRGRPVGFVARNLGTEGAKYVNSPESLVYEKRKTLLGIDVALTDGKKSGIFIVEGPGDLAALHRVGIYNVVATCGTAFTADHLALLKMLGIRQVYFALDWDEAGKKAMRRVLKEELKFTTGVSCFVVEAPKSEAKDVSQLLEGEKDYQIFTQLRKVPAFEWVLTEASNSTPEDLCLEMVPIIASEQTAVRREMLIKVLADTTGISMESISEDVRAIRDSKTRERNTRLQAAAEKYKRDIEADPSNAQSLLTQHQDDIAYIEKEFNKQIMGADYQLSRYDALQETKFDTEASSDRTEFKMGWFTLFGQAFSGGMSWTEGALIYVGGRANSGKTATCIAIATDIALHDPDAIVIMHFTDDSYAQVEPRIKTNIANMLRGPGDTTLTIGMSANPKRNIMGSDGWSVYNRADKIFRELIASEKLTILDQEDGSTLSTLERNIRTLRSKFPEKKMLVMCDNTHNYMDYLNLDQTMRMTRISDAQKNLTGKYKLCMIATAEYRKNMPLDSTKMKLPVDDDLADARALMYRPNAIIHVYNDLHDRKDNATIYWTKKDDPEVQLPRLCLCVTKNKLTEFKDKLIFDLDPKTVAIKQEDTDKARFESTMAEKRLRRKNGEDDDDDEYSYTGGSVTIQADYD